MGLTATRLREVLDYNPKTGVFTWRIDTGKRRMVGKVAGVLSGGRFNIGIDGKRLKAHRLAWLYVHGDLPNQDIDHINGDATDNRLCNLRLASKLQNRANTKRYKNNRSGFKGVHFHPQTGKWRAQMRLGRKTKHLGLFENKADAADAYFEAAKKAFGEFACNGERASPDK